MKYFSKLFLSILLITITAIAGAYFFWYKPKFNAGGHSFTLAPKTKDEYKSILTKLNNNSSVIKKFAADNKLNTHFCFMIDMSIPSGRERFFVYNLQKDSVELAGLVTHGQGSPGISGIEFSNTRGSNCTSLGKYKIGGKYNGKFGLAYKLYGLDKTNNNALERFVVLHAHECVPDAEVYPLGVCQSQGCPTVSPKFLQKLANYIDVSDKAMLLNIYK